MDKEKLAKVWPEWEVVELLGKGSFGRVYKVVRRDSVIQSYAAIKVISIPTDRSELDSLRSEGLDDNSAKVYFKGIVDDFVGEIRLMESLKGIQNIVSVEDYKVVQRTDEVGWDIYIRMELLTPFNTYICDHPMSEKDVIKLGVDICSALEICSRRDVVHRDVKPENIFINDFGHFKLGDFGIARKLENVTGGMSQKGTYNYMAPEVALGIRYDARVDLYSLGIMLYRLLNGNKLPFIETEQQLMSPTERKNAVERRIRGERMLPPSQASAQMAMVIMRACAYDPEARFPNAAAMKDALIRAGMGTYMEPVKSGAARSGVDVNATVPLRPAAAPGGYTPVRPQPPKPQNRSNTVPPVRPVQKVNPATPPAQPVHKVNSTTPPVHKVNSTTPPVRKVAPAKKAETKPYRRWSGLCFAAFAICNMMQTPLAWGIGTNDTDIIVFCALLEFLLSGVPFVMSIVGLVMAKKRKLRGKGFAILALLGSLLSAVIGLGIIGSIVG